MAEYKWQSTKVQDQWFRFLWNGGSTFCHHLNIMRNEALFGTEP